MADLFLDDEASVQTSRPTELIDIVLSTGTTYRIACGNRDMLVGSVLYKATPSARANINVPQTDGNNSGDVTIELAVDHPVVTRWLAMGVPPRQTAVTVWRKQERSGLIEKIWSGLATSLSCDSETNVAKFLVPARTIDTMQRSLPTITAGQTCPWVLYGPECQIDRAGFTVTTTAILVDGRDVRLDMGVGHGGDWAENGELLHVATGERMTIAKQTDIDPGVSTVATVTMQLPIPELRTTDAIQVFAGCKKSIAVCVAKFANRAHFGGFPAMPTKSLFTPGSIGTKEL